MAMEVLTAVLGLKLLRYQLDPGDPLFLSEFFVSPFHL
jgi:hypothetical protein